MLSNTLRFRDVACALFACLMLASPITAEESWLTVTSEGLAPDAEAVPAGPTVVVEQSDAAGISIRVTTAGLALENQTTKGGEFVSIRWPDAAIAGHVGSPAVPVMRRLFVAPPQSTVTVTSQSGIPTLVDLGETAFASNLVPIQAPIAKLPGAIEQAPFDYDANAYAQNQAMPTERAVIEELGVVRGYRLFLLEVAPVAYNPVAKSLTIWPEIQVEIRFSEATDWAPRMSAPRGLDRIVLNPEPIRTSASAEGNYLIVVASDYESDIADYAAAKSSQGYDVITWVPTTATTTAIKEYIEGLWGGPNSPDYILLVGDTNTIPHWTGGGAGSPATDLPYSCMDGPTDWYPDIALGRFPVRTPGQLQAIVDKTLYYENGPLADPDYMMRAVFMASEDNYQVSEGTHNWVIENYMDPNGIVSDKLYCHTYDATTQQVRDAFNDGRFYGIYSGHGSTYSWADGPPFSQSDVNGLFNENMYPFVCSFACVTGTYTVDECFVETWIRAENKGALAIYGSSVNSYWTEDDVLEKRLFDAIYDESDSVPAEVGPVWNDARMRYLEQMGSGSTTRRYFEMYNLMGDPSLAFFGPSAALTISLPEAPPEYIEPGTPTTITVQISDGAETVVPDSCLLHYRYGAGGFLTASLAPLGEDLYEATLPAAECGDTPHFYFSATGDGGTTIYHPEGAPQQAYAAVVATVTVVVQDDFETDLGWTVENIDILDGAWERGVPAGDGSRGDPISDFDGSGQCYLTANRAGDSDVDGGPTRLFSPLFDLSGVSNPALEYARWWSNDDQDGDCLDVHISNDGGATWVSIESVPDTPAGWVKRSLYVEDLVPLTSEIVVRFSATDNPNNSVDEGAVDAVAILEVVCGTEIDADFNGDGKVDLADFAMLQVCCTGPDNGPVATECVVTDLDADDDVDADDCGLFVPEMTGP